MPPLRFRDRIRACGALIALLLPLPAVAQAPKTAPKVEQSGWTCTAPTQLYEIERVVDGDTIYVRRSGEVLKLRLLAVDTEEKASTQTGDASKPSTAFGEECAQWAAQFFADLAEPGSPSKIGVLFPGGHEDRDAFGRLLCHVILPDGRNYNLLLVQLGKSPYFNKYGNDTLCHQAFVEAQREARAKSLGIWNPAANVPKTAGAPSAKRPYEQLIPWWDARAAAVDEYRARVAKDEAHVAQAEIPRELERAFETSKKGEEVEIFGLIERLFDEDDGSQTVLFRSGSKEAALRVRIAKAEREKFAPLDLAHTNAEFKQNYLWVRGRVERGTRGFEMRCSEPASFRFAGPQPKATEPRGN